MTELNLEQGTAIEKIESFLRDPSQQFFLLAGSAGTGKTHCMKALVERIRGKLVFTAPTNKATKVLREALTTDSYKPDCRTIYSLLALRLEANGEIKELTVPEDPVDLMSYRAIIVDEASMINQALFRFIKQVANEQNLKFIFLGDFCQLPSVKESRSEVWNNANAVAELSRVMRHDNAILRLATHLRGLVGELLEHGLEDRV